MFGIDAHARPNNRHLASNEMGCWLSSFDAILDFELCPEGLGDLLMIFVPPLLLSIEQFQKKHPIHVTAPIPNSEANEPASENRHHKNLRPEKRKDQSRFGR